MAVVRRRMMRVGPWRLAVGVRRQPEIDASRWVAGALGATGGAALMFLLDPDRGARRRATARDKVFAVGRRGSTIAGRIARDLGHRARGSLYETRAALGGGRTSDDVIAARVCARLGHLVSHPGAVEVTADDGHVTLGGPVWRDEADGLLAGVASVRGVLGVGDALQRFERGDLVPALQGTGHILAQGRWPSTVRLGAGGLAGSLLWLGMRQRGGARIALGAVGLALLGRAVLNRPARRLLGLDLGRREFEVRKRLVVRAPVEEVFAFLKNVENLPRFMAHLEKVTELRGGRSHWRAVGPAGIGVEWDARIVKLVPNERIAWESLPGSSVHTRGEIVLARRDDDGTELELRLWYAPPAGALGHVVALLFGVDPKSALDEDLSRFKSLIERGATRAHGERVTKDQVAPPPEW